MPGALCGRCCDALGPDPRYAAQARRHFPRARGSRVSSCAHLRLRDGHGRQRHAVSIQLHASAHHPAGRVTVTTPSGPTSSSIRAQATDLGLAVSRPTARWVWRCATATRLLRSLSPRTGARTVFVLRDALAGGLRTRGHAPPSERPEAGCRGQLPGRLGHAAARRREPGFDRSGHRQRRAGRTLVGPHRENPMRYNAGVLGAPGSRCSCPTSAAASSMAPIWCRTSSF